MGDILGGVVGGIGSIIAALIQQQSAQAASQQALTGYNYLTTGPGGNFTSGQVANGTAAGDARSQLLGLSPLGEGTQNALSNYLDSTGYKFQLGQGIDAITGSQAAKGLLNSGSTLKAMNEFGQGLASTSFDNYLNQLGGVNNAGYNSAVAVGNAGTGAGSQAAQYTAAGGNAIAGGVGGAIGSIGGALTNALAKPKTTVP